MRRYQGRAGARLGRGWCGVRLQAKLYAQLGTHFFECVFAGQQALMQGLLLRLLQAVALQQVVAQQVVARRQHRVGAIRAEGGAVLRQDCVLQGDGVGVDRITNNVFVVVDAAPPRWCRWRYYL